MARQVVKASNLCPRRLNQKDSNFRATEQVQSYHGQLNGYCLKIKIKNVWGHSSVVDHLSGMGEARSSNPKTTKQRKEEIPNDVANATDDTFKSLYQSI